MQLRNYIRMIFLSVLFLPQILHPQQNLDSLKSINDSLITLIDSIRNENSFLKGRIVELENLKEVLLNQINKEETPPQNKSSESSGNSIRKENNKKENTTRQCKAILKNGKRCSRNAKEGSDYCWQHQKINQH